MVNKLDISEFGFGNFGGKFAWEGALMLSNFWLLKKALELLIYVKMSSRIILGLLSRYDHSWGKKTKRKIK